MPKGSQLTLNVLVWEMPGGKRSRLSPVNSTALRIPSTTPKDPTRADECVCQGSAEWDSDEKKCVLDCDEDFFLDSEGTSNETQCACKGHSAW
jgi:hypothetical protein